MDSKSSEIEIPLLKDREIGTIASSTVLQKETKKERKSAYLHSYYFYTTHAEGHEFRSDMIICADLNVAKYASSYAKIM